MLTSSISPDVSDLIGHGLCSCYPYSLAPWWRLYKIERDHRYIEIVAGPPNSLPIHNTKIWDSDCKVQILSSIGMINDFSSTFFCKTDGAKPARVNKVCLLPNVIPSCRSKSNLFYSCISIANLFHSNWHTSRTIKFNHGNKSNVEKWLTN